MQTWDEAAVSHWNRMIEQELAWIKRQDALWEAWKARQPPTRDEVTVIIGREEGS